MPHAQIVDAIYQSSIRYELWSETLCSIVDYVGAVAGNIVYQAPRGRGSFLIPGRMREDLNSLYLQQYAQNPYARAYGTVKPGEVVLGNTMVDVAAVERSSFYTDICMPQNIHNQLFMAHASLHEPGGIGGVALFLSRAQDEHAAEALKRLRLLASHIERAIDLSLHVNRIESGPDLAQRLINAMPDAAVLIGSRGEIILLNTAAEALLNEADGISIRRNERLSLAAQIPETSFRMTTAIRQALTVAEGGETPFTGGAFPVIRPSGLPPYLATITPLAPSSSAAWDATDSRARVLLQIVDTEAKARLQARRLRTMFDLTEAETRVATLIGSGMSLHEIARALGVSPNTIKTHAARCFAKVGVRSQAALARLVASIPV
ncbi:helix-turn-helix transcriptional regulator [Rhizobium laguerreae]|uniref:Helix-turn-helix transcriptional regulator n=2 Tax=Rhizobium laguerreae TaxID=1076926 RepID=A0AAX2QER1_9HYPH|nr:helix-turn-helix transcriptional regulator [Rhizobium laguerreae]MBY3064796.1 helix-turn-helix transcriptional regulator [Rhizobium laguerreae]MBY3088944.1 helix-turn-helix transcriptional regulator [Rhizobium laguerreae]MBY3093499.1 helix-turn-helix transcriptional regulator [Rhizobium laguerreae]MBY3109391.1 helix-turn-helix transcriptional regulator [Rhizobium laguerreae]MBY3130040.1 helix-turn-helix transcriptional regulator [Rhizobium laguerreae]